MITNTHLHRHGKLTQARCRTMAVLLSIAATAPAHAQFNLGLSPMRVELNAAAGTQRTGTLTLGNESQQPARFKSYSTSQAFMNPQKGYWTGSTQTGGSSSVQRSKYSRLPTARWAFG